GWFANPSYLGSQVQAISATDYGDKEFWAKWTVNDYKVTLNTNGGTITSGEIDSYIYGVGATLPTAKNFVKTGATFGGWYADEEFSSSLVVSIPVNETGDKEFWAKWTDIDYTITYNVNEGQFAETPDATYTYGGDTVVLPTPTRDGYTFGGWFSNSSYLGSPILKVLPSETGDKEFWAKWNVNTYKVTLNANEGKINSGNVKNYIYGTTVVLPSDVTKTGYTFDGWYTDEAFSNEAVLAILSTDLGDKTFYANWTKNSYGVTFVTNEGVISEEQNIGTYEYGTGITLPTEVSKEGYTFFGWYTNSSFIGGSVTSVLPSETGDKTFYAKWIVNEYKVSADYDMVMGTVTGDGYFEYKSPATLKAVPNDGYEFVGWNDNEVTDARIQFVVTKDTTLTANFKEKEKVQIAGTLEIPTLKTERESAPIDLIDLFVTTEGSDVIYSATSSAPNVVAATVSEGKLFLTVYEYEGEAEITVTATLPNGEKNSVKATANVVLACNIQVAETITNVSCFGESDGEIALKVTNAAEPYTTQWQNETYTEDTIRNVKANAYTVVITDNEECSFTKTYTVSEPAEMTMKATIKHPTCSNADGSISIDLTGVENASFAWSNEATTQNVASLEKGEYSVVVTNTETGCQISDSYTLVEPEAPVVTVSNVVSTACNASNGAVTISVSEEGLLYSWSNNKTTKNLTNVPAGDYTLSVVNPETNCTATLAV
ncbi:MAG: InlB B-repeat-containing protein, partial [Bacteroidales bacterium]|nr:InlB B-repeat-containing protein [Bacteroidales bacterium]